jgi:F0F1-type ATP synthase assembly protein I
VVHSPFFTVMTDFERPRPLQGISAAYGLLGAMIGGAALGYGADYVLHTGPWGLLVGCLLGFGAGLYSVYQALMKP